MARFCDELAAHLGEEEDGMEREITSAAGVGKRQDKAASTMEDTSVPHPPPLAIDCNGGDVAKIATKFETLVGEARKGN